MEEWLSAGSESVGLMGKEGVCHQRMITAEGLEIFEVEAGYRD